VLIFHEGLPRSGKSYSACVDYIIEALKSGRRVFACIAGLDHQKFADVCNMDIEDVKALLIQLKPSDVGPGALRNLWGKFPSGQKVQSDYGDEIDGSLLQDSLLVIDEIQNLYPSKRQKLEDLDMQFIAEHGHYGMDILIMSQSFKDVHPAWRRRIQRMSKFTKLTAVGMDQKFKWEIYEGQGSEQFQKISSGVKTYDPL
jgi:zona occludens toxin